MIGAVAILGFMGASQQAWAESKGIPPPYVEYQGHRVTLAKAYLDFKEYKNDPDNLTDAQSKFASGLVRQAPFGPRFKDAEELLTALDTLQFPGYGYFFANQVGAKLDPKLEISSIELPKARMNRYLITEVQTDGAYLVVADFIASSKPEITRVRHGSHGELQYRSANGKTIRIK